MHNWLGKLCVLWVARMLKRATGGQGFAHLEVSYDSAIDSETYRVWVSHERDGDIFNMSCEDPEQLYYLLWMAGAYGGDD